MKPSLIVHLVSYSPGGKTALETAVALARVSGADLHVLKLTGRRRSSAAPIVRPLTDADIEPHFAEFVRSVYSAGVRISAVELVGDLVDAVAAYAKSASADLVVVADRARSHGPYWRRGMYANDLARHLSVPLVSVPAARDERLAREGTSSGEANSHAEAINRIIGESMVANAPTKVEDEALVRPGTGGAGTAKVAGKVGADLIVVARQPAPSQVSMNSPLVRVLRNAPRPVLILPAGSALRIGVPPAASIRFAETALSR